MIKTLESNCSFLSCAQNVSFTSEFPCDIRKHIRIMIYCKAVFSFSSPHLKKKKNSLPLPRYQNFIRFLAKCFISSWNVLVVYPNDKYKNILYKCEFFKSRTSLPIPLQMQTVMGSHTKHPQTFLLILVNLRRQS